MGLRNKFAAYTYTISRNFDLIYNIVKRVNLELKFSKKIDIDTYNIHR